MVDQKDIRGLRQARTELSKRGVDIARADLQMRHGLLMVRGTVAPMPGASFTDLKIEMEHICRCLRQKAEIREVIMDCVFMA